LLGLWTLWKLINIKSIKKYLDVKSNLTTWVSCCCSLPVTFDFMIMCLGNHILCNVSIVWICVFQLRSNGCYLWKCVVNIWISIYVRFLLHICVVSILMVVVFKYITFCIVVTICWSFNHPKGFKKMFSSFIVNWRSLC
jgi:hypothetical protein